MIHPVLTPLVFRQLVFETAIIHTTALAVQVYQKMTGFSKKIRELS
jgi:hypothetical protein